MERLAPLTSCERSGKNGGLPGRHAADASAAIEEDYAKRLSKLSKMPLGKDEVGDLQTSLQTIQAETGAQASYHLQLSTELHQTVEQPTAEFGNRLTNLKKGLQASVEKSWRSKGMHEGHVAKVRGGRDADC